MSHFQTCIFAALAAVHLASAPVAGAVAVDGTLDPEYGPALVTQSIQTGLNAGQITGDNNRGELDFANGSELDGGYAFVADDTLHLFLAGNLALALNANQNGTIRHVLEIFLDTAPGGQGALSSIGSGDPMNGLIFDAGFEADYRLQLEGDGNGFLGPRLWTARFEALPTGGGGSLVTLGSGSAGGPGTLAGGTNPAGIMATMDNRNVGGVPFGCDAASGEGVTTGVEWAIPLAAIGNPEGCVRLTAMVRSGSSLSNQVLGAMPVGTCPPGSAATMNFTNFAGDQFFTVCPGATDVPGDVAPTLALALSGPNPARGDRLRVTCSLSGARPARLQLIDGAGRAHRDRSVSSATGRSLVADLSAGRRLAPGVYWLRLSQGGAIATRKFTVVW